jgi:hypothetical protein
MILDFDEAAQLPVTVRVKFNDGSIKTYELPKLEMIDYAPWLDELTKKIRDERARTIPANLQPLQRWQAQSQIEGIMATFDDVRPLIGREEGANRVLRISMRKANIAEDEINHMLGTSKMEKGNRVPGILGILGVNRAIELATALSAMFQSAPPPETFGQQEGPRKNSSEPASTSAGEKESEPSLTS